MSHAICTLLLTGMTLAAVAAQPRSSPIITYSRDRGIESQQDAQGNRVPDFSTCGYAAGLRSLPTLPARVSVDPIAGDATARIQAAIDYVSSLPADAEGSRGAVLLLKGTHQISGGLRITNSGVVLRGQGSGPNGTILRGVGQDRRTLIRIVGRNDLRPGRTWPIADPYVPVGAAVVQLSNTDGLKQGQDVRVVRPSSAEWIQRLGAAELGGGVGGGWKPGTRDLIWDLAVQKIEGNQATLAGSITTAIEQQLGGGYLQAYTWTGRISHIAVERLSMESVAASDNPKDEDHAWCGITLENAQDAWVRQVNFKGFAGSAVAIYETCRRITVRDCISTEPKSEIGGYRRHTFFTMGQQTLFLRCYAEKGRHDFSLGHCAAGPNAFVQCESREAFADSGPIESWASGVLYDNVVVDGNAMTLGFRPGNNAGTGWSAANCVLWNCSAAVIRCWNPPGAQNWSFGSWAGFEGDGIWRSSNDFMDPDSLFHAQLSKRAGSDAAARLQLMPRAREESSNPTLERAQALAAASHQPAASLKAYIEKAGARDPIELVLTNAKPVQAIPDAFNLGKSQSSAINDKRLAITNGWLTCGARLLIGGTAGVPWWRGSIRPVEMHAAMPAVTRFVPGRTGLGYTDELSEVADFLVSSGKAALDHNYGLWYERRRDDHERVRRMDGGVLPPFYEQPFARSGHGAAWDGLSRYDLACYNPWYWGRLRDFAEVCERRGLVLFHQNYFQHHILEAGAHWADFPWRSANNINETGFPEPPPYAGDKRIFQAELFYDTADAVRRPLHRAYIRQCLSQFTNHANVIQFTSAEFTGPLPFMQFWLDTIAEWEREVRPMMPPMVALSATKDLQDAILADSNRRGVVDVVDFRYWWRTGKGEFAPPGGKNLAPRQFERQWRGGRPTDEDLAGMAAEYREQNPDMALICDFDSAGWAWICAGGSLPRLPRATDSKLLSAIPRMRPWVLLSEENTLQWRSPAGSHPIWGQGRWALAEPGIQWLLFVPSGDESAELELRGESASFAMNLIDPRTGACEKAGTARGGTIVRLPRREGETLVLWLVKEP